MSKQPLSQRISKNINSQHLIISLKHSLSNKEKKEEVIEIAKTTIWITITHFALISKQFISLRFYLYSLQYICDNHPKGEAHTISGHSFLFDLVQIHYQTKQIKRCSYYDVKSNKHAD